jgi:Family of unknown function (DUF6364)
MDTKLTLKLEQLIIEKAKTYAKSKKTSISKLIENYLQLLVEDQELSNEITPLVKSLSGIIKNDQELNDKKTYGEYLSSKYN